MRTYIRTLVTLDTLGSIPYRNVCCNTTLLVCCCTGWSPACLVFLNNRYRNCVTLLSVDFLLNILNEVNNFLVVSLNFYRVIIICAVLPALWNIYLNVCCSTGIRFVVLCYDSQELETTDDDYSVKLRETTRKLLTSLRIFSRKSTDSRVTQFLYLLLRNTRQAGLHPVQQHTRSVVLQQTFLYGMLPSVSSVTSVLMYVLMQQSVQSL